MRWSLVATCVFLIPGLGCEPDRAALCRPLIWNAAEGHCDCPPGTMFTPETAMMLCTPIEGGMDAPMDAPPDAPIDTAFDASMDVPVEMPMDSPAEVPSDVCMPRAEVCNGLDDDCDGTVDGPIASAACGTPSRATASACSLGACVVTGCASGYQDCDDAFPNGCEAALGTSDHCGMCNDTCGWQCESFTCNDAVTVDAGGGLTCAVRERDVLCWGTNADGLGDGTSTESRVPVQVSGLSGTIAISAGATFALLSGEPLDHHVCALSSAGAVRCWGANSSGQLGNNSTSPSATPGSVSGLPNASAITTGTSHTCVLASGSVYCWGENSSGEVGNGVTGTDVLLPYRAVSSGATFVGAGVSHSCAVVSGVVRCWGSNTNGRLGDGTTTNRPLPTSTGLMGAAAITGGNAHTCALLSDRTVRCWGDNSVGQVGDGTTTERRTPTAVRNLTNVVAISAGQQHTCAVVMSGRVYCWGGNGSGQLGSGSTSALESIPVEVSGITTAVWVTAGGRGLFIFGFASYPSHSCAILRDGSTWCWGYGGDGQLGTGTTASSGTPVRVIPPL